MKSVSPRRSRKPAVRFVAREEPEADGDLRRVEELARQRDHAVDEVGLDDRLADLALARLAATTCEPFASTKPAMPVGARWWMKCCTQAKFALPAGGTPYFQRTSSLQALAAPVAVVERRVGEDVVGLEVLVQVAVEAVGVLGRGCASMPRMARFIFARRQVVWFDSWP